MAKRSGRKQKASGARKAGGVAPSKKRQQQPPKRKPAPRPAPKPVRKAPARPAVKPRAGARKSRKAKPVPLTPAERVKTLLQLLTPKQVARKLKVSTSTVRKYRDGKSKPGDKKVAKRLTKESSKARKKILNQGRAKSQNFKTPKLRVPLVGRRQTRIDPRDRSRRIPSDTIIFDARDVGLGEIAQLLLAYRKKHSAFRVIYLLPKGKSDYARIKYREDRRVSTAWESLSQTRFSGVDGVLEYLEEVRRIGKILYVVVTDRGRK